jgi:hypothetical protein
VLRAKGGPIEQILAAPFSIFHQKTFQASAFLCREVCRERSNSVVFAQADGTGTSDNPVIAEHMAVSEALERWAFRVTSRSSDAARFGFDVDRSSNGMAAYPGFKWQAKRRARYEALERFALIGWWDGRLEASSDPSPYPDVSRVRIHHGQDEGEVVILYHKAPTGFYAYGHAAARSLSAATKRAAIELARAEFVISRYRARGSCAPIPDSFEQRCLHFSTPEGHTEFLQRLYSRPEKQAPKWRTIFDGEILGPWSRWATIWRHCVEMPTYDFLDRKQWFFLW